MCRRMKLVVAYLGSPFHGWQRQRDRRTVQGELEAALARITGGRDITVVGAGRTDAGVHAAGQVAHCDVPAGLGAGALARALGAVLPEEIRIRGVRPAGARFHARISACGKLYTYRARWRPSGLPWRDLRAAVVSPAVDLARLADALALLPGVRDWASFTVPEPAVESTERALYRVELRPRRDGFDVDFVGSGFLRYQVRRMLGCALEVAVGRRRLDELRRLLEHPQAGAPIRTAPADGLCLERVYYRRAALLRPS